MQQCSSPVLGAGYQLHTRCKITGKQSYRVRHAHKVEAIRIDMRWRITMVESGGMGEEVTLACVSGKPSALSPLSSCAFIPASAAATSAAVLPAALRTRDGVITSIIMSCRG